MQVLRRLALVATTTVFVASTVWTFTPAFGGESTTSESDDFLAAPAGESLAGGPAGTDNRLVNLQPPRVDSASLLLISDQKEEKISAEANQDTEPAFWVIDTRRVPNNTITNPQEALTRVRYFAVDKCGTLRPLATDDRIDNIGDSQSLWIVVHGNRVDSGEALMFMKAFRRTVDQLGLDGRFVLWSWPSGVLVRGIARDSRLKAARADLEASLLASWLARHELRSPIVLVGYSFGARTVLRAVAQVHSEGPSPTQSGSTTSSPGSDSQYILLLVAPAIDAATFDRLADQAIDGGAHLKIAVTVNRSDPALRWYRHLWSCHGPDALGWQGPSCRTVQNLDGALDVLDVTRQVGHTHRWETYLGAPAVRRALQVFDPAFLE